MSRMIRVVENGVEKEVVSTTVKKVKLDKLLDAKEVEEIMNEKKE